MSTMTMAETKTYKTIYQKPVAVYDVKTHYCAGCGHGILLKLMGEVIDELGIQDQTIAIAPVGCAVLLYKYLDVDGCEASHGRAPAVATGIKRVHPDNVVICYQGDGDLLAIGMGETIHAASRGEKITVIFVNNAIYGMTGGQMAPTTLPNQKTLTTPFGRDVTESGYPLKGCEIINSLDAPVYIERCAVHTPKYVMKTKKAIKKAIQYQMEGKGYSFVEVLSMCPTNWGMSTVDSVKWMDDIMTKQYPIKQFRDITQD